MNHADSQLAWDVGQGDVDDAVRVLLDRVLTRGACVGTDVPQKWFPRAGFTGAEYDQYADWACRGCPVQAACLTYAVHTGQTRWVWGGLAEHRLRDLAEDDDTPIPGGHGHPATGINTTHAP